MTAPPTAAMWRTMTTIRFTIPFRAAHALLAEAVLTRGTAAGLEGPAYEFEDSNTTNKTRIACSVPMGLFIVKDLRRLGIGTPRYDAEFAKAMCDAADIVEKAIGQNIRLLNGEQSCPVRLLRQYG
jgi:GNAT superfamily N-acetyltransferase